MAIDRAEVRRIARLARLELDEATTEAFTHQLQSILDYVAVLGELDTASAGPATPEGEPAATLREDVERPSLSMEDALAGATEAEDGHFRVPRVLGE